MKQFIEPALERGQYTLLRPTLDESIGPDHPVRVFDFTLDQHDFGPWRAEYLGGGRPAFDPKVMCKLLVYGYSIGIRSSRALEHACTNSMDFIWLMQGLQPDHDTIADFRRRFREKFKDVFRTSVAACVEAGMVTLAHVAVDGTRVAASNARQQVRTAEQISALLAQLDERIEKVLSEAQAQDDREDTLYGKADTPHRLPKGLKDLQRRQARLKEALKKVTAQTAASGEGIPSGKRVPVVDPDAKVMKSKDGGFGPNYNPYVGVDTQAGVIVSEDVTDAHADGGQLPPALEAAEANTGLPVQQALADASYGTPENLTYCEEAGIDPCIAPWHSSLERSEAPPVWPIDVPGQVARSDGSMVDVTGAPRGQDGKFSKAAFPYDAEQDCYTCPRGDRLGYMSSYADKRNGHVRRYRVYRCRSCAGCPLRAVCGRARDGRVIKRGEHEEVYARHAQRMQDAQHQSDYRLRRQTVEPAIGLIKEVIRLRKFLLRGFAGVRAEWSLGCAAINVRKLAAAWVAQGTFAA